MNTSVAIKTKQKVPRMSHLLGGSERMRLLRRIRGMWKNRKPTPIRELKQMRREWERDIM